MKPKKFNLNEDERSDYFFYFRLLKEREMEMQFWQDKVNSVRYAAMKRVALDPKEFTTDWNKTLEDGTFTATKKSVDKEQK